MNPMSRIGTNVRARRTELGLSLEDLAEASGLSKGFLSQLENGQRRDCTSGVLQRIGIALKCRWWKLAEGEK